MLLNIVLIDVATHYREIYHIHESALLDMEMEILCEYAKFKKCTPINYLKTNSFSLHFTTQIIKT